MHIHEHTHLYIHIQGHIIHAHTCISIYIPANCCLVGVWRGNCSHVRLPSATPFPRSTQTGIQAGSQCHITAQLAYWRHQWRALKPPYACWARGCARMAQQSGWVLAKGCPEGGPPGGAPLGRVVGTLWRHHCASFIVRNIHDIVTMHFTIFTRIFSI
jgi:hypothetical protein